METQDLIYLLTCAVHGQKPDPERVAGMDTEALYELAARHMLAATVAPALEAAGLKDERFARAFQSSVLKNAAMDTEMDAVFAEMDRAGIWHMALKGVVLQNLYPTYGMRQMSDHDILFDADRAEDLRTIMERLGFRTEEFGESSHDIYYKEPVSNFEMHRQLFGVEHDRNLKEYFQDVQDRLLGDGTEKHLSPEDLYLYLTAHEYKHYSREGTGLRSLLDTYLVLRQGPLDMDYVAAEAEKLGVAAFEAENRALAQRLFSGGTLTATEQEKLDYILSSGVYGNIGNLVENRMQRNGWSRLQYALNRFLVPVSPRNEAYESFAARYPVFYKYKILLPLLPFRRILRGLKNGRLTAEVKALRDRGA